MIEFWFEFASTYSYLSAMRIERLASASGVGIAYRPFLLGPIFASQGWNNSPFNIYPAKGRYMWRDLARQCERYGLPLRRPSTFPRSGLTAARVALAAEGEVWLPSFVRAVYSANFSEDRDIASADVIASILERLGQPAHTWLERAGCDEIKQRLRQQTETAQSLGIFGAPSFVVRGELFWGDDRLEQALEWSGRG